MDIASARRQLAALFLALLSVIAFSGAAFADCLSDFASLGEDCHEPVETECEHHAAGDCLASVGACEGFDDEAVTGERKLDEGDSGTEPVAIATDELAAPRPGWRSPPRIPDNPFLNDQRDLHLRLVTFLE